MLELYLLKTVEDSPFQHSPMKYLRVPESLFAISLNKIDYDDTVCSLLKSLDNVEYAGGMCIWLPNDKIDVPFTIQGISVDCKAAIVLHNFRDRIVYLGRCGRTALGIIFSTLDSGRAYIDYSFEVPDFEGEIMLHCDTFTGVVSGGDELRKKVEEYYGCSFRPVPAGSPSDKAVFTDSIEWRYYHYLKTMRMSFELRFRNRVTIISFDNDYNKSQIFHILQCLVYVEDEKTDNGAFDIENHLWNTEIRKMFLDKFGRNKGKYLIIDDSINMLDPEDKEQILNDMDNQYIIFTHNLTGWDSLPADSFAELVTEGNRDLLVPLM